MSAGQYAISKVLGKLLNVQPGERRGVWLLLLFSFLAGVSFVFYSTASISVFVSTFHAQTMPYAFIASGVVGYVLWLLFARIQKKISFTGIIFIGYLFLLLTVGLLFLLMQNGEGGVWKFMLFVWMRFYTFLNAVMFGALFARVFDAQQGKRLFALISAGDVLSQMIGYFSIPLLTQWLDVSSLFIICMIGIFVLLCFLFYLRKAVPVIFAQQSPISAVVKSSSVVLQKSRVEKQYYRYTFLLSMLPMLGFYYVDYLFLNQLKIQYSSGESMAGFLGLFLGMVAIVELVVRLFASGRLLTTYGLRFGIFVLPAMLLLTCAMIIFFSAISGLSMLVFSMLALGKLLEKVCRFSFNDPAFQLFYQPVPAENRFVFRARMEGVPKALGVVLAGLLILSFNAMGLQNLFYLVLLFVVVLVIWLMIASKGYHYYSQMLLQYVRTLFGHTNQEQTNNLVSYISQTDANNYQALIENGSADGVERNQRWVIEMLLQSPLPTRFFRSLLHNNTALLQSLQARFDSTTQGYEQLRILALLGEGGADEFIWEQAMGNETALAALAIRILKSQDKLCAQPSYKSKARSRAYDILTVIAWYQAAIRDTGGMKETACQLVQSLAREKRWFANHLFELLSVAYDPVTMAAIRNSLVVNRTPDGKILAIELAEQSLDEEMKKTLLAILLPDEEDVEAFATNEFFPQQLMDMPQRLVDIIRKDYQFVPIYIKQFAIAELSQTYRPFDHFKDVFVECLQNEHPPLVITTARVMANMEPEVLAEWQERAKPHQQRMLANMPPQGAHTLCNTYALQTFCEVPGALLPKLWSKADWTVGQSVFALPIEKKEGDDAKNAIVVMGEQSIELETQDHYLFSDPATALFFG